MFYFCLDMKRFEILKSNAFEAVGEDKCRRHITGATIWRPDNNVILPQMSEVFTLERIAIYSGEK